MKLTSTITLVGRRLLAALAICLALTALAGSQGSATQFSSIVVFGDSLSDTGRLYQLTGKVFPMPVAYWQGRQSNGPVWVEYLARDLGVARKLRNYAVIGALTAPTEELPSGNVSSDTFPGLEGTSLAGQLAQYLAETGGKVDPNALYIIEGGANDLIQPLTTMMADQPEEEVFFATVEQLTKTTVSNVVGIVMSLRERGAQNIAVVNLPNFAYAPRFVQIGGITQSTVYHVVLMVNDALAGALNQADELTRAETAYIDAARIIEMAVQFPAEFGFTNVTDQFMTLNPTTRTPSFAGRGRTAANTWFFWDDLHPSTAGHEVFAQHALGAIRHTFPGGLPEKKDK